MNGGIDLDYLREWIGREEIAEDELTPALAARFAATIGLPLDVDRRGAPAPRLIHFCMCQPAAPMAALGADGHPARGGFLPSVPLERRMWAASDIRFTGDLKIGGTATRRSRVADVVLKVGRTGALCFVTVDHAILSDGIVVVEDRQTLVYRGLSTSGTTFPPAMAVPRGEMVETVDPSPTLLFRYSALTFNGHRIHYDQDYARGVEGYSGLVVHGPLQATLLFHLAARMRRRAPDAFSFRGVSPLTHVDPMELHAGPGEAGRMALWTARPHGPIALQAEASWS